MDDLEWHDFGLKKASKNSIVYPTLKFINTIKADFKLFCIGFNTIIGGESEAKLLYAMQFNIRKMF